MSQMGKCQEFLCERQAKQQDKRTGHYYCSDNCALVDSKRTSGNTKSDTMQKFGLLEVGVAYEVSLHAESVKPKELERNYRSDESDHEASTIATLKPHEHWEEQSPSCDTGTTPNDHENTTEENGLAIIHSPVSEIQLPSLKEELSQQMNSIDDSIQLMHGLTKHVVENIRQKSEAGEFRSTHIDPNLVMAACHSASKFQDLVKLKMKVLKFTKGK